MKSRQTQKFYELKFWKHATHGKLIYFYFVPSGFFFYFFETRHVFAQHIFCFKNSFPTLVWIWCSFVLFLFIVFILVNQFRYNKKIKTTIALHMDVLSFMNQALIKNISRTSSDLCLKCALRAVVTWHSSGTRICLTVWSNLLKMRLNRSHKVAFCHSGMHSCKIQNRMSRVVLLMQINF